MRTESFSLSALCRNAAHIALVALAGAALILVTAPSPSVARAKSAAKESAAAKSKTDESSETADKKGKKKDAKSERNDKGANKPEQLGTFGDWDVFAAQAGKDKTCYALGRPKDRQPKAKLKDVSGYVFISTRPAENVRNEVAINLGYATKDGSAASADIDGDGFELVTKSTNAWVKDTAKEKEFVKALKEGGKLIVKASSAKGTTSKDSYSLEGLAKALDRVQQECK